MTTISATSSHSINNDTALYNSSNILKNDNIETYLSKFKTSGLGLFNYNITLQSTLAEILLIQSQENTLWEVLDSQEYNRLDLTHIHGSMKTNLICAAAKVNNFMFIQEWAKRGLPLQDKSWNITPLFMAINNGNVESVIALDEAGADWFGEYDLKDYLLSLNRGGFKNKEINIITNAWVLAITSPIAEITKIAFNKKTKLTSNDWESIVFIRETNNYEKIKLRQLIGKILGTRFLLTSTQETEEKKQGLLNRYKESWWNTWKRSGAIEQFKTLPEWLNINLAKICDKDSVNNYVCRALTVGMEKPVTLKALQQCIDVIVEKKHKNELMWNMTAARAKILWDEKGPLANEVYTKHVQVTHSKEHTMPLFPFMVLKNIRTPVLWKDGANNYKLAEQFWNTLKDRHANKWEQQKLYQLRGPFSPKYGIPREFDVSASKTTRKAVYNALDIMAKDKKIQEILPILLKEMLHTKNILLKNNKAAISSNHLLEIAVPILWGIERGFLNAKDTYEFVLTNKKNTPPDRKLQFEEWISQIERYILTTKIITKIDISKPMVNNVL